MLRRKTPLKRTGFKKPAKGLKRSGGLRARSKKQDAIMAKYKALVASREKVCVACGGRSQLESHHPHGRGGVNVMEFYFVCASLHHWIHFINPSEAYRLGWLTHKYRGTVTREEPEPWLDAPDRNYCKTTINRKPK